MSEAIRLCMGCMNPLGDDGFCAVCGYNAKTSYNPKYLSPNTVLLNRYIIGKVFSFSGEGATYIAYDKILNEKKFIKEFMPDTLCERVIGSSIISVKGASIVQYKSYLSEFIDLNKKLMKMKALTHINAAEGIFEVNNTAYTVFEYIDGISLKHFLQDNAGELSWEAVRKLFPPIFTTLSLIHNAGLIHRGISLDTIFYTNNGELRLTGFAVAATRTVNTDLSAALFTGYAAPEQYCVRKWQGTWTDVYSISALLYRMLTGCMPTDASERVSADHLLSPHEINPNIPKNISSVIMEGMCLNSEMRIQTITELVTKLFSDLTEDEEDYYQPEPPARIETVITLKGDSQGSASNVNEKPVKHSGMSAFMNFDNAKVTVMVGSILLISVLSVLFVVIKLLFGTNETSDALAHAQYTNPNYNMSAFEDESLPDETVSETSESSEIVTEASVESFVTSAPTTPMPDLTGGTYQGLLGNEELKKWIVIVAEQEYNDDFAAGVVYYQDIPQDTLINAGQIVNIKVSKGSAFATIPDYTGLPIKEYLIRLDALNIKYDTGTIETSEVMKGYVVKTSKPIGDKINLVENEILYVYEAKNPN